MEAMERCLIICSNKKIDSESSIIIAVDSIGALAVQFAGVKKYIFWSLEVINDFIFRCIDQSRISCVVTQTKDRYDYLFRSSSPKVAYFIQNSPILNGETDGKLCLNKNVKLVFIGNAIKKHGIFYCLEYLRHDDNAELVIRGIVPNVTENAICDSFGDLLASGRLVVDKSYINQGEIVEYLRSFDIGLCFYDDVGSDFNYISCLSGKLFNYYAAALPIIGSNILGLKSVKDFKAGVLIEKIDPNSILNAVTLIKKNYYAYSCASARASRYFDFAKNASKFLNFLDSSDK